MAVKWFCDQCGKELVLAYAWTVYGAEGPVPHSFCGEACVFGWFMDRETEREEAEEKGMERLAAELKKDKKAVLVEVVETMLEAAHDFLDEDCEQALS